MTTPAVEFGFVAALEREVSGLVRNWRVGNAGGTQRIYQSQNAVLICAGTGVGKAYAAAQLLVENYSPRVLISMGFAGACAPDLAPGAIFVPATLVEAATGKSYATAFGHGRLATMDRVAGKELKRCAFARFGAQAVDMEAAGVAAVANESSSQFVAIKAISDGTDEDIGFLSAFVEPEGFATRRFVAHIALRPALWPRVAALQRNSRLARAAMGNAVGECISNWQSFAAKHSSALTEV
jgi:adenosylhomocysteine nucleosidase